MLALSTFRAPSRRVVEAFETLPQPFIIRVGGGAFGSPLPALTYPRWFREGEAGLWREGQRHFHTATFGTVGRL